MYAKVTHCVTDHLRYSPVNFDEKGFVAKGRGF